MTVTFMTGFEGRLAAVEGLTLSSAVYSTAQKRTGEAAVRCNPASGQAQYVFGSVSGSLYQHFGLYIAQLPSVERTIVGIGGVNPHVGLRSDGKLSYYGSSGVLVGTSTTELSTGRWYWIGSRGATGTNVACLQIDGTTQVTGDAANMSDGIGFSGTEASAADIYLDDFIVDNADFLAPSKVDIAFPISDNTVTGVTDGNGGTANLWECVNNVPPAGVASANEAANPTANIRFPASTTENYIANLETYSTLGIGSSDTVLAVRSIVRAGEDIATGSKNLQNVGALTNPTVAGQNVLLDSGAHGAETGFWGTTFGTLTTSPSVTLDTSPTIRASRTSESRVACVDFMGMLVAWTPAAAVDRVPRSTPYPHLLPH